MSTKYPRYDYNAVCDEAAAAEVLRKQEQSK